MNNAAAKVTELSAKRDELKNANKPNEELRDLIVALKMKLKKLPEGASPQRAKLEGEIAELERKRVRAPELHIVMTELSKARAAASQEALDAFMSSLSGKTDQELEAIHLELTAQRSAIKPKVAALAQLRSSRAKIAANKTLLKDLTPAEILASLTPEQRKGLAEKK